MRLSVVAMVPLAAWAAEVETARPLCGWCGLPLDAEAALWTLLVSGLGVAGAMLRRYVARDAGS